MMQSTRPLISVVIPTYNRGDFILSAINSVLDQDIQELEILVVDNYSTDNTEAVVKSIRDPRVRYFQFSNAGVIARSRNFAMSKAKGQWLAFLDSDDLWIKTKLSKSLHTARVKHVDVCYHLLIEYTRKNMNIRTGKQLRCFDISKDPLRLLLLEGPAFSTSSVLVKADKARAIAGFCEEEEINGGEDYDFFVRLAEAGSSFAMINEPLGFYHVGVGGFTNSKQSEQFLCAFGSRYWQDQFSNYPAWYLKSRLACYLRQRKITMWGWFVVEILRSCDLNKITKIFYLCLLKLTKR